MDDIFKGLTVTHIGNDVIHEGDMLLFGWDRNNPPTHNQLAYLKKYVQSELEKSNLHCAVLLWSNLEVSVMTRPEMKSLRYTLDVQLRDDAPDD